MPCDVQKEAVFARGTAGNVFTNNLAIVTSTIQICNLCVSLQFRGFVHYLTSSYCNLSYIPAISMDFFLVRGYFKCFIHFRENPIYS